MRSWKRRTRYLHKRNYLAWKNSDPCEHRTYKSRWATRRCITTLGTYVEPYGLKYWRKKEKIESKQETIKFLKDVKLISNSTVDGFLYIEDCRYHPCEVKNVDVDFHLQRIDFSVVSLVDGKPNSCSYYNCGIEILTREEAYERKDFFDEYGFYTYMAKYSYAKSSDMTGCLSYLAVVGTMCAGKSMSREYYVTPKGEQWFSENTDIVIDEILAKIPMTREVVSID